MEIYRKGKITVDSEMIMEQLLLNSEACGVLFEKVKRLEKNSLQPKGSRKL